MKKILILWRKTIFKKLVISFICILVPVYGLNVVIYNWGIKTLHEEISNSMVAQVSYYMNGLEKEIQRIQTLQHDCLSDENLNKLAVIPDTFSNIEKMQSILYLQQRLSAIKNSSEYINDVYAVIPEVQKKISSRTIYDLDTDEYNKLKRISIKSDAQVTELDGKMILNAVYPFTNTKSDRNPIFIVVVELSKAKIEGALHTMISSSDEGVIFINQTTHSIISNKSDSLYNKEIEELIYKHSVEDYNKAETIKIGSKRYLAVYTGSEFLGSILCKYVPEDSVFQALKRYKMWFLMLAVIGLSVVLIYSIYMYNFIHKPLNRLARAFKKVENGELNIPIEHKHDDEFGYIYRQFNRMTANLNTLIDQVYKQTILAQKAELKQLQSQINPHFLYNSFFILNTMSRIGDYDNIERFTEQLGEYFQFITRSAADEIPLSREVNHARIYTEIQTMRFSDRIKVEFDELPEKYSGLIVPRLILQPVIENAFEHGLERKVENGLLLIKFIAEEDMLDIVVEDNGDEVDEEKLETLKQALEGRTDNMEITGIINIHQRLQLKYGPQSGIRIVRGELGGLKVILKIKLVEGEHNVQAANC